MHSSSNVFILALAIASVNARDNFDALQHLGGNSPWFPGMADNYSIMYPISYQSQAQK